jgi:predicted DNA-binding transcriptional regulator AlpA
MMNNNFEELAKTPCFVQPPQYIGDKHNLDEPRSYAPDFVSAEKLAFRLDCSRSTIDAYVKAGFLPKPQTIGNLPRWDFEEVGAFIRAQNAAKGEARGEDDLYMQGLRLHA